MHGNPFRLVSRAIECKVYQLTIMSDLFCSQLFFCFLSPCEMITLKCAKVLRICRNRDKQGTASHTQGYSAFRGFVEPFRISETVNTTRTDL